MEGIIMSKWRKPLKNQRRFDARYFLNERMESEGAEENSVQQEKLKKDFNDFSFDSWLAEAAVALEEENVEESPEGEEEEDASYGEALEEAEDITEDPLAARLQSYQGSAKQTKANEIKKES